MTLKTFLFDLDGTLVDSGADLTTGINLLRDELNLESLPEATVRGYVGDGARLLVARALPEGAFSEERLARFMGHYEDHLHDRTTVYPGIVPLLERLKGYRLGVVTNKPQRLARQLLDALGLAPFFAVVVGGDTLAEKKPAAAPVCFALEQLQADPASAILIGDHHTDLWAGQAAGVQTCFCAYGLGVSGGAPYDFRVESPAELQRLVPAAGP
jgi:phosphoglycolate phosphatase